MKMLFNNKGISLVVLIVAMTLIAILGTSFVSLMGSKQKGFLYQIDAYRALNIANAGVEYAIRCVSDGLSDTNSGYYSTLPTQSISNTPFANGSFAIARNYDLSNIANDYIEVTGSYQSTTRKVRLSNFRRYLNPITLVPDLSQKPSYAGNRLTVPVIANNNIAVTVTQIDLTTGLSLRFLRNIYGPGGTTIFDYTTSSHLDCGFPLVLPCRVAGSGIWLPPTTTAINLTPIPINPDTTCNYVFEFASSAPSPAPLHVIKFYSATVASELRFTP
jgi:hypothetical protein